MDPLSDLLRVVRLDGAYFYALEASGPWGVESAPSAQLVPRIMPSSEHLIAYHILSGGHCFGGIVGEEPVEMSAGDVIVFPHGDAHLISSAPRLRIDRLATTPVRYPFSVHLGPPGPVGASFVCGYLGCDRRPFNPLLAALPRCIHVRALTNDWIAGFIRQVTEESKAGRTGAEGVLTRLAELMFIEVIRRHLDELPEGQSGWLAGLKDAVVGRALAALHAKPARDWSLDALAREAATSRSGLTRRFTQFLGQSPMQYLSQWRIQLAATALAQGGATVAAIAGDVGYESEAAFSRAFKKATSMSPGAWRAARRPAGA
jgi:AraC-like DNA-binding protein